MTENAYVTLVATDIYAAGALVIAHRLRDLGSTEDLVCLVTSDISPTVLEHLSQHYKLMYVDTLKSADEENLALLGRPELDITFTKLHLWSLTEYKKLVFLDADTLPLRNIDELFDRPNFSAAPDSGWPDCFNSGVFVTEPSVTDYNGLKKMATEHGSFDGGDQGLLNRYFGSWSLSSSAHRLPFTYNTTPTTQYSYAPAHQYYLNNIAICHFIGLDKPWKYQRFSDGNVISHGWKGLTDLVQSWWDTWNLHYGQNLPHLLLSRSPKTTLLVSHATTPIKLFSNPTVNAWDTQNIADDIELHKHHRRLGSMPPLENITISTPKWAPHDMQASSYPGSSEIQTLTSSNDDKSQYSSLNNDTDSFDFTSSVTDHGASNLVSYDNKRITNDCELEQQSAEYDQGNSNDSKMYQTIDWNPAYEVPPNTGIAADIPDLSTFVNAWDQPFQNQPVWVAPEPQPIPQMDHHYGFVHEHHQNRHHQHDNENRESPSFSEYHQHQQNIFPWEANIQQTPDPTRVWLDEQVSLAPINHHLLSPAGNNLQPNDWYKDNEKHQIELINNDYHQNLDQQNINHNTSKYIDTSYSVNDNHREHHQQLEQQYHHKESHDFTEFDTAYIDKQYSERGEITTPTYAMDLISPPLVSPGRTPRTPPATTDNNNDQMEFDWSDRDLIPIQLKSSSKLNIDGLSPKIPSSPISSRRSSLSKSRRPSISSIKSHYRTPTAVISPVIVPSSISTTILTQPLDYSSYSQQPMSIFAQATRSYSKKTPYTSAATTPVRERTSFLYETEENQNYLPIDNGHVEGSESGTHFEINPLENYILDYSFDEPLKTIASVHRQNLHHQQLQWDPQAALERLQHTSEFIMRQIGQEPSSPAPIETAKNDASGATNPTQPQYALDAIRIGKSAEDDIVRQFNASGSSSPRTPMVQGLEDNLTAEIEAAKEQHRQQQQASLSLLQPRAAVATLLEAELDLSKSSLFNRRNDQHQKHHSNNRNDAAFLSVTTTETSSSSAPTNTDLVLETPDVGNLQGHINTSHETNVSNIYGSNTRSTREVHHEHHSNESQSTDEPFSAHFDVSVMEAARRKLNALTQNVSETSMSSTATMNEQQDDDLYPDNNTHSGTLHNLSRYSFPPARFEYTVYRQTPTTVSAFDGEESELATSTSSTLHERSQAMDHGSGDMAHLQPILDDMVDLTTENEAHRRNDDEDFNNNDQNISTWLSLTSANTVDSPRHTDDTISSTIEGNLGDTLDNGSIDSGSCDSEDEDNNIIISTIDYTIEIDEVDTFSISETNHTHTDVKTTDTSSITTYSPRNSGLEMDLLDTTIKDDTLLPSSSSTVPPPQLPSLATCAPLSASALSKVLALKGEATKSTISASDDGDTTFLSAIEGTLTPGGSSTISSTVEWYTAGTSTPVLGNNDSNFGDSDEEHQTALSLLHMRTNSMAENSINVTTVPTTATTVTTTTSTKSTSNNSSFEEQQVQIDDEDAVITGSSTEYIDIYDSLSTDSENTETGSN